ncbi:ranBP2-type zinc finger protein At1g67325-like [Rutidosis leptorrhynchoides]|uniref:ranBP2-type zinc finger protein At1g67325-like n=1 Tax=Rutidosis leptorrhynchoides TaxID=125765 RepID=UPI003A9A1FD4
MSQLDNRNSSAVKRARTDGGRREDDWTCPSCGNVNFSFRTTCNMRNCTQPRPADHNSKSAPRQMLTPQSYSASSPYGGSGAPSSMYMGVQSYGASLFNGSSVPPYDGPLSSGSAYHYNYNTRLSGGNLYRPLHTPPYSGGPMLGSGGLYGLPQLMEQFGLRLPMGQTAMGPRPGFFSEETSQKKDGIRENDWACPKCGNVNFAFRTVCNMRKCGTPKPAPQVYGADMNGPKPVKNPSKYFMTKCNRQNCGADKPLESQISVKQEEENDQGFSGQKQSH